MINNEQTGIVFFYIVKQYGFGITHYKRKRKTTIRRNCYNPRIQKHFLYRLTQTYDGSTRIINFYGYE